MQSRIWTKQPQIVVPSVRSPRAWSLLWNAATPFVNISTGEIVSPATGSVTAQGQNGVWRDFRSASAAQVFTTPVLTTATGYTYVFVAAYPAASLSATRLVSNTGATGGVRFEPNSTAGGAYLTTTHNGVAAGPTMVTSVAAFTTRQWVFVQTYDGTTATLYWLDEFGVVSSNAVACGMNNSPGVVHLGNSAGASHGLYMAAMKAAPSTVREVHSLLRNPWQLFSPLPAATRGWVAPSTGAATHTTTGALAAQAAVIAGTAAHKTLHTTSGALASQAAVIAGTATHLTLHATSGALAAQSAVIAGTAVHQTLHATSGALTSQSAVIAGTATHEAPGSFDTTGAISSQSAVIAGTAAHFTLHATSGALAAQAASISGTAQNGDGIEPSRNVGAGRSRKQRLRVVEIDGVDHVVSSEAEAQALIDKAKEAAEELAKLAVERAAKAQKRPARKVLADARKTLAPIEIKAPVELQPLVDQALAEIQAIYKSAINTIEISTLLRKREAEEEDDEDVLLLL